MPACWKLLDSNLDRPIPSSHHSAFSATLTTPKPLCIKRHVYTDLRHPNPPAPRPDRRRAHPRRPMTSLARLRRQASTFLRQPRFIQAWFLPVWVILGIGKALIFTISFRRLAPRLGHRSGIAPWVPLLNPAQEARARLIGRVVRLTANHTPWDSNCFPQAIAARVLLGFYRLPYSLFFGLMRDPADPAGMKAHAWVAAGRVPVTGGVSFGQFTVVGCFVAPCLAGIDQEPGLPRPPAPPPPPHRERTPQV